MTTSKNPTALTALLALALCAAPAARADDERPACGDVVHGAELIKTVRVDGAWLNAFDDDAAVEKLKRGQDDFPRVESDNALDAWDALALLRSKNTDLRDLASFGGQQATHVLVSETKLDENAEKRLKEQGKLKAAAIESDRRVYALFKLEGDGLTYVAGKDAKKRDKLKKDTKLGYVVFLKIPGFRGGSHEAAFAIDKDMRITQVVVRAPDGSAPAELNQAAARFVGKGARGRYDALKAGGAGKALSELADPLSDAYLLAAEAVYMFEVAERDYFQFD